MIDCSDCQKRLYDLETGKPKTYDAGPPDAQGKRKQEYFWGPKYCPCRNGDTCPKGTPETAHEVLLSPKNTRAFLAWQQGRVDNFAGCQLDDLARDNLSIVQRVYDGWQRMQHYRATLDAFSTLLAQLKR